MVEIEPRISDFGGSVVHRRVGRTLFGDALLDVLNGSCIALLEFPRPLQFLIRKVKSRRRCCHRGLALCEPDLIGLGVDGKQAITLMDDRTVLEMDSGQRPAYLRTNLDRIDS
ncbi:hypothetical protein GCM10027093_07940 [Paraburkholderia jirisanensis]